VITKGQAINNLQPNAKWLINVDGHLDWQSADITEPTQEEIDAEVIRLQALEDYQAPRRAEYPSIGDQLDSLYHAGTFDSTMTAAIKAVKDKYPKP